MFRKGGAGARGISEVRKDYSCAIKVCRHRLGNIFPMVIYRFGNFICCSQMTDVSYRE